MTGLTNSSGFKTFQATAVAIANGIRVKVDSSGLISAAGVTDDWIGVTTEAIAASGYGTVKLRNAPGTFQFTAAGAFTCGSALYPAASGKVDDASGVGNFLGFTALDTATADGDLVEAAPGSNLTFAAGSNQAAASLGGAAASLGGYGFHTSADAVAAMSTVNAIRQRLIDAGLWKGAA